MFYSLNFHHNFNTQYVHLVILLYVCLGVVLWAGETGETNEAGDNPGVPLLAVSELAAGDSNRYNLFAVHTHTHSYTYIEIYNIIIIILSIVYVRSNYICV